LLECAHCKKDFEKDDPERPADDSEFCSLTCQLAAWKNDAIYTADDLICNKLNSVGLSGKSEARYYADADGDEDYCPRLRLATHDPVYEESCDCVCLGVGSGCVDCNYVIADDADDAAIESAVNQALESYAQKFAE